MSDNSKLRKANAERWGHIQAGHLKGWYDLEAFRAGKCSLRSVEAEAIGDISGKSILHMQCNCGLDTLSLTRRGAKVTGVDLSEKNISFARGLAREVNLDTRFICCDVLELDKELQETFDIVMATYGIFCWIDDLERWMRVTANHLKSGGHFIYVDCHPAAWPFNEKGEVESSYFHEKEPLFNEATEDDMATYEWQWTVADIVNSAIKAGLTIEELGEHPFTAYQRMEKLVQDEDGWWRLPGIPHMPLLLSMRARKA